MPPVPLPKPRYLRYALLTLTLAVTVLLGLPYLLHFFDAGAGGFGTNTLNVLALAATLFWAVLQLGFLAYRALFGRFKIYLAECLEEAGKLFENVTDELRKPLFPNPATTDYASLSEAEKIAILTERRKVSQYTFTVRCVRLAFCLLVLFGLLHLAEHALTVAMLASPGGQLSSLPQ
ncbi:MAG: hypothetical protein ACRYFK_14300 [Janthinobacterium lividum]